MSVTYLAIGWNRNKIFYDCVIAAAALLYVSLFIRFVPRAGDGPMIDEPIIRMRAYGSCAFLMLSAILCIGPLARLDARWLPLLYNRRHFGVLTCGVALLHAYHVLGWYFAYSPTDPFVALLSSNQSFARVAGFPFEWLGLFALAMLLVLAATSHDFWLSFLTPPLWKAIHMGVYAAYVAVIGHIALGSMLAARNGALAMIATLSVCAVVPLHLLAARKSLSGGLFRATAQRQGWIAIGDPQSFIEDRGTVIEIPGGERAAVFRHTGKLSAMANACAHQNGPLGEGRVYNGCVTCPWHGFEYRLEDGCAPAPFTEKLATYALRLENGVVWLDTAARPPGTRIEPLELPGDAA